MSSYLNNICAVASIYLFSEILKLVYSHDEKKDYDICVHKLWAAKVMDGEDVFKTCAYLNNVSSLQTFANDFGKSLMVIYVLFGTIFDREIDIKYWAAAHLSALIFSYLGTLQMFQFSFDSFMKYDNTKVFITCACSGLILPLVIWNLMRKSIAIRHILGFLVYYICSYLLYFSTTMDIEYHLHHSFVCTFLSYFCTEWSCKLNMYAHSILIGIAVQGLAFYRFDEYNMLNISNEIDVRGEHITILYAFIWTYVIYTLASRVKWDTDHDQLIDTGALYPIAEEAEEIAEEIEHLLGSAV